MNLREFDIDKYVEGYLAIVNEDELSRQDYDNLLNKKATLKKNVKKLLEYGIHNKYLELFSFEEDVLRYFPLNQFSEEEVGKFINHILSLKNSDSFVGNKVVSNLSKISVDNKDKAVAGNLRSFDFFYMKRIVKRSVFANGLKEYMKENRDVIRRNPLEVKVLTENIVVRLKSLKKDNNLSNLSYVADYVSDCLLQMFNYWVITLENINYDKKMQISNEIESYLKVFEKSILNTKSGGDFNTSLENAISIFVSFLTTRNDFGEYMSILNTLEEEQEQEPDFFSVPIQQYKLKKNDVVPLDMQKEIITEGIHVDEYTDKFEKTKELIVYFSQYGGRKASVSCALDLKVYFRELYLSDSKYKRQASTIVRKFLEGYRSSGKLDSFEKFSEYEFLREKISRGYFRETSDLRLYNKKNQLQHALYKVILSILLTYDYVVSLNLLISLVEELIPICFKGIDEALETNFGYRIF